MTVAEAVRKRRSIRKYSPDPVPPADLLAVLEAGRLAPSGCNCQPWRFIVVRSARVREALADQAMTLPQNALICRQAPVLIVALADLNSHCAIPERILELAAADPEAATPTIAKRTGRLLRSRFEKMPSGEREAYMSLNVAVALAQMMLQATELGYGTCWLKAYDEAAVKELLQVPPEMTVVAITPLGRPLESPPPRPRVELSRLVHADRFGEPLEL